MDERSQNSTYYLRYKDIAKQKAREYCAKNKEKINETQREKYKNLSFEEKKKLVEKQKNGLINKLKRNKIKWGEKQESILKIDIIIILLLLIRFVLRYFTWFKCKRF